MTKSGLMFVTFQKWVTYSVIAKQSSPLIQTFQSSSLAMAFITYASLAFFFYHSPQMYFESYQ